jgi:beta-glucosidase
VWLEPGSSAVVNLSIAPRSFARWDSASHSWETEGGTYELVLGRNAHDVEGVASVVLPSSRVQKKLSLESSVTEWFEHPVSGPIFRRVAGGAVEGGASVVEMVGSMPMRRLMKFPGVEIPAWQLKALAAVANNGVVKGIAALFSRR